jgi:hypothetical protein
MVKECRTRWGQDACIEGFGGKARKKNSSGRPRCGWGIILKLILGK